MYAIIKNNKNESITLSILKIYYMLLIINNHILSINYSYLCVSYTQHLFWRTLFSESENPFIFFFIYGFTYL